MPPTLILPLKTYRGLRRFDEWGAGGFGAPRSRGPKRYGHHGQDFVTRVGDEVLAAQSGMLTRLGWAYQDDGRTPDVDESELRSIHILREPFLVKILYAEPVVDLKVGDGVTQGDVIAHAQDRAKYAAALDLTRRMTNHIHVEVHRRTVDGLAWEVVDPLSFIFLPDAVTV